MFLGFKAWIALDMITTMQMIHLIPVARLYLPSVLNRFFKMFQYTNFKGLQFGILRVTELIENDDFADNNAPIGYNFDKMGFNTTSLFYNITDPIIFVTYLCFIPALLGLATELFYKVVYIKKLESNVMSIFFQFIIEITMTIMTFSSMMNLYRYNVETTSESVGSYCSVLYMIFLCLLFMLILWLIFYYSYELRTRKSGPVVNLAAFSKGDIKEDTFKGKYIFFHYRTDHSFHYSYPLVFITRRVLVSYILVWWNKNGFYQLVALSALSLCSLVYTTSYAPFVSKTRNIFLSLLEGLYL